MQIIIDISEDNYKLMQDGIYCGILSYEIYNAIKNGTPLDDIKAEIENDWQFKKYPSSPFSCGLRKALEIIDKYKAESKEVINGDYK